MSVVGIDLGNLNTIVAVARNRGIDVITNETSNRATPSLVSFGQKQRFLGEAAKTLEVSNFKNTVSCLKRLIGRSGADPSIQRERTWINANLVCDEDVKASVFYKDEMKEFSYIQLVAMFLTKVKEFTQKEIKIPVSDVVISVPLWFSDQQRRALLDAAQIAGLNCLRLINDTTAAALGYGITKTDLPDPSVNEKVKPKIVCFVDFGNSSYQVSVVAFTKGKLVVKGTAFDKDLGGRDFDEVLVNHFVKEFSAKYKMDIASNKKAVFRLRQACEKVKKVLSANAVTMLNVECLMDDKDVSAQVSRQEFEEWIAPLVQRLSAPIEQALAAAQVNPADVEAVELIGGCTRIPIVKETLSKLFGDKLSTTLNQDEAVARGCALQCAIISPVFKVRDFAVQDWNNLPVQLSWDASVIPQGEESVMEAFGLGNSVPSVKALTVHRQFEQGPCDFVVNADYTSEAMAVGAPIATQHIGQWTLSGIKKMEPLPGDIEVNNEKATLKIKAKLDAHGLVRIESAQQLVDVVVQQEKTETEKEEKKKVTRKYDLVISGVCGSLTKEKISQWIQEEGEMGASDRLIVDTAEKRNALEEYVYETRSKLEMAWSEYVDEPTRVAFMANLNAVEEWLYTEEGEEATKSIYVEKLIELRKIGDPIALRAREAESRPVAERQFKDYINSILLSLDDEKYAHISAEEKEKVKNECNAKNQWLNDHIGKQNELPKHAPLVVTCEEIHRQKNLLTGFATPILSKPKPKEEKKTEQKEEEKKDEEMDAAPAAEENKTDMEVD